MPISYRVKGRGAKRGWREGRRKKKRRRRVEEEGEGEEIIGPVIYVDTRIMKQGEKREP